MPTILPSYTAYCQRCGGPFKAHHSKRRVYCSRECHRLSMVKPPIERICEWCGKLFTAPARPESRRFCSSLCARRHAARCKAHSVESFWALSDRPDDPNGCWTWRGNVDSDGYGRISFSGRYHKAHQLAYRLSNGVMKRKVYICHKCGNRLCVNPEHLYHGNSKQNAQDMIRHGRSLKGERNHNAKLTSENVREIRKKYDAGGGNTVTLAAEYGVTQGAISHVVLGKTWIHVK